MFIAVHINFTGVFYFIYMLAKFKVVGLRFDSNMTLDDDMT